MTVTTHILTSYSKQLLLRHIRGIGLLDIVMCVLNSWPNLVCGPAQRKFIFRIIV